MSSLSSDLLVNPQDLFDIVSGNSANVGTTSGINNDGAVLGALATTGDGRYFRWVAAGATALVPGKLQQSPAEVTANEALSVTATAVGATSVTTTTTVTVTANQYTGGYMAVTETPGQGYLYQIGSHPAVTSAALTFNLVDPIIVALTTGSQVDLVANPYNGVIVTPITTRTGNTVGVAVAALPATYFGWVQVRGIANVLAAGAIVVGEEVCTATAVSGACTATTGVLGAIGTAATGIADTDYGAIALNIS